MIKRIVSRMFIAITALSFFSGLIFAKGGEFNEVVHLIEAHYHVKHRGIPLLGKVGMKAARAISRDGEPGSLKLALFEDQDFAPDESANFSRAMRDTLQPDWQPLVEVREQRSAEQTYIYLKEAGKFYKILLVNIERRDATALQVEISPEKLAELLRDPNGMGKTLADEATGDSAPE